MGAADGEDFWWCISHTTCRIASDHATSLLGEVCTHYDNSGIRIVQDKRSADTILQGLMPTLYLLGA